MFIEGVAIDLAKSTEELGLVFFRFLNDLDVKLPGKGVQALDRGVLATHDLLGVLLRCSLLVHD